MPLFLINIEKLKKKNLNKDDLKEYRSLMILLESMKNTINNFDLSKLKDSERNFYNGFKEIKAIVKKYCAFHSKENLLNEIRKREEESHRNLLCRSQLIDLKEHFIELYGEEKLNKTKAEYN